MGEVREYALRILHTGLRRSLDEIRGETEFIYYLASHGVPCTRPLPSPRGRLVEQAEAGDQDFVAVAFEWAEGANPEQRHYTPAFSGSTGRLWGGCTG